jgi:Sulfatase-modifying factor enzyme 1
MNESLRHVRAAISMALALPFTFGALEACRGARASAAGPRGAIVSLASSELAYGFPTGGSAIHVQVAAYAISAHPISVGEYRACVTAGVCTKPKSAAMPCAGRAHVALLGPTYADDPSAKDLPVTCVTPSQSGQYCQWTGGELPTPEQWLMAARGPSVQPYAWGSSPPDCQRVPSEDCPGAAFVIGKHPAGAAPSGMQDVLLTPRELLRGASASLQQGCGTGAYCVAGSLGMRGEISQAWPIQNEQGEQADIAQPLFGFRCAWEAS